MQAKQLLIIGFTWPEPNASAVGGRMLQLIRFFLEDGYRITLASTAKRPDSMLDWEAMGLKTVGIVLNDASFDVFIKELRPTVVLFDRYLTEEQFGWRVAEHAPNALRVLDTEDLHSLRNARKMALQKERTFHIDQWLVEDTTKRELASIYRCDVSLIISSYEVQLLQEVGVPETLLLHLPFMVQKVSSTTIKVWSSFEERAHLMFIGTGRHKPNVDCIRYLHSTIWPGIRAVLPAVELHIYGSYLTEHILSFHHPKNGFIVKGATDSVAETMQRYRVHIAPLRFGAGIKGKHLDAMQYGIPSITTAIGAEGMHYSLPWNGYVVDDPMDFIKKAVVLYKEKKEWRRAQENGIRIVNEIFDKSRLSAVLKNHIDDLMENLTAHRIQNIVGAMLLHHTNASTKYMGKWIEEKQRKAP